MLRRLAKLRLRFGIAAPKVAVRTAVPWYVRWTVLAVLLAFSAALAAWIYDAGRRFAGFDRGEFEHELAAARKELAALREELANLRATANAAESRLAMERAAQAKLAQQIRSLEHDNARLREELAIFEAMASSDAPGGSALSILRFKVEPDALPGEYRYRLLLRAPLARRGKEFQGRVELLVNLTENGRSAIIKLPDAKDADGSAFRLSFKHFQRVEGLFRVSPNAKVESVQVRVYESGSDVVLGTRTANVG
ncbi:MAG: hypothetical protein N2653_01350 [Burkholderiales bacterium]|nr:hypothetical protein [Burkholderiales bacterium]